MAPTRTARRARPTSLTLTLTLTLTPARCGTDPDQLSALKAAAEQELATRTDTDEQLDTAATSELKAKLDVERRQIEDERKQLLSDAKVARENAEQMVRAAPCPMPCAQCPI